MTAIAAKGSLGGRRGVCTARYPAGAPLVAAAALCLLIAAARPSSAERVSTILRRDADAVSLLHTKGLPTTRELLQFDANEKLWQAAEMGDVPAVTEALAAGADIEFRPSPPQWTPLWIASAGGHTEVVKVLIAAGADVEAPHDISILFAAIVSGNVGVVQALLAAGTSTAKLPADRSALVQIEDFIDRSQDPYVGQLTDKPDSIILNVETPLIMAVVFGYPPIVEALLQAGVNPNERDSHGDTALHWAPLFFEYESEHMARALVRSGAFVDARGNLGATPFHVSARWGNVFVAKVLLEAGADTSLESNGNELEDMVCPCARSGDPFCPNACFDAAVIEYFDEVE